MEVAAFRKRDSFEREILSERHLCMFLSLEWTEPGVSGETGEHGVVLSGKSGYYKLGAGTSQYICLSIDYPPNR